MPDYTLHHLAAANVEEPAPEWPSPEPVRRRVIVKTVVAFAIYEGIDIHRALVVGCRACCTTVPPISADYEWWEWCCAHLGCTLTRGEFKADEFWQTFVRVAVRLLGEC